MPNYLPLLDEPRKGTALAPLNAGFIIEKQSRPAVRPVAEFRYEMIALDVAKTQ